jgi:O-antigen/teichoic acid export membrane protein
MYFKLITAVQFIYLTAGIYFIAFLVTMFYAFRIKKPVFKWEIPAQVKGIIEYSFYIILSGSVANLLLDGDKIMLNQYLDIGAIGIYSVATFIALVISVPSRAMHQIVYPITAKLMHDNKYKELNVLYKKTSINLQMVGGFVMLCIFVNINQLYELLPKEYAGGIIVVFMIGISKYFDLILGNNNAIIFNSKYYRMVLFLGVMLAVLTFLLNWIFIPLYGIIGSAFATLLSITAYSIAKLYFVVNRMHLYPFSKPTLVSLGVTLAIFLLFYFWQFPFHPLISIVLKSILLTLVYVYANYKMVISPEINQAIDTLFIKLKIKK